MPEQITTVGIYISTENYYSYDALRAYEDAYVHGDNAGYLHSHSAPIVTIKAYDTFEQVYKGYTLQNAWSRKVFDSYFEDWTGNTDATAPYRVDPVKIQFSVLMFENQSATVDQWYELRDVSTGTGTAPLSFSTGSAFVADTPTNFISAHTNGTLGTVSSWLNGKSANPVYEIADASGTSVMTAAQAATLSAILPSISVKTGTTAVVTDNVGNLVSFLNGASSDKILDSGIKIALTSGATPIAAVYAAAILGEADSLAAGQVINVSGTPLTIGQYFASLKAGVSKIGSVNVNGEIPLTYADFLNSGTLFAKFNGTYSFKVQSATVSDVATLNSDVSVSSIEIVDAAGAVETNLIGLRAAQGKISAITLSNAATTRMELLVTQVVDNAELLALLADANVITVRGTSAQVAASIDQLGRLSSQIHSIELADSATPLALNASQTITHLSLIEKITSAYSLAITDQSENVAANLTALNAHIAKISSLTLSDINSVPFVIDYAQRDAFINLSGKITWPLGDGWENRIVHVEGVTLAQAQEIADLSVTNQYKVKVGIVDTAANLESGAALLRSLSVDQGAITDIELLDRPGSLEYEVYRAVGNFSGRLVKVLNVDAANVQAVLSDTNVQDISLRDSAANLSAALTSLVGQQDYIQTITLSDTANPISITVPSGTSAITKLDSVRGVTSKFAQTYGITMVGVNPNDVGQILRNNSDVVSVAVQGRSDDVGSMLTELHNWGSRVASIEVTDAGSVVPIGAAQLLEQSTTLDKLVGSFTYSVSADYALFDAPLWALIHGLGTRVSSIRPFNSDFVRISRSDFEAYADTLIKVDNGVRFYVQGNTAEEALTSASDSTVYGLQIADTAANLSAHADALLTLASSRSWAYPLSIMQTDVGTPLQLTSAHALVYARLLSRFETPLSIKVVDTSANIGARLEGLYEQRTLINEIVISDGASVPLTMTANDFHSYEFQFGKLTGSYSFKLTDVTLDQVIRYSGDARISSFDVSDDITRVGEGLDRLLALGDKLNAIRYNASSLSPLTIDEEELETYRSVLVKIIDGYTLNIESVQAESVAALLSQSGVNRISVEDTASNVVTYLDSLETNRGRINDISIVDSNSMVLSATKAMQHAYMLSTWVLPNSPSSMTVNIVDVTVDQLSNLHSYLPSARFQIADISSNLQGIFSLLAWYGDSIAQVSFTDNVNTLSMSASMAGQYQLASDKFLGNIKVRISDAAFNVQQNLTKLIELGSRLESIELVGSFPSLSMSIAQFVAANSTLSKIVDSYTLDLSGTTAQLSQNFFQINSRLDKIRTISISDENRIWSGTAVDSQRFASLRLKITNLEGINIVDHASQLSHFDLSTVNTRKVTFTPTLLDSDIVLNANRVLHAIDFSRLSNSTFEAIAINDGDGASIKITQNGVTRKITIVNKNFNDLVITGGVELLPTSNETSEVSSSVDSVVTPSNNGIDNNTDQSTTFAIPIENIEAIGISPDGRFLIIKSSGLSRMVSIDSTLEFANATISGDQISNEITPTPVFSSVANGSTQYVLPDLFTGPASLGLKYQLIDTTPNAVVTGSSENDFIKVADANSIGKAVDGGGGNDVIDGGVGSTFISGGGGSNIFFLDGRASGVSWSTITDFQLGQDKVTIWGWRKGVSKVAMVDNSGGAPGYDGLTLHFENLLPSDAGMGATNERWNSITLSGRTLSDLGASSVEELNAQILAGTNSFLLTSQTVDDFGTHGYLHIA